MFATSQIFAKICAKIFATSQISAKIFATSQISAKIFATSQIFAKIFANIFAMCDVPSGPPCCKQ